MSHMTPQEIVHELDKHIVGQTRAKRAVAIALRNRWRRQQVAEPLRQEITPKNILMIGPTGVGKTEIARRLARLADAPFIKVEATKFTEVGYVGRDVDAIVRDLAEIAIKDTRESAMKKVRRRAEDAAEERVLDVLLPGARRAGAFEPGEAGLSGKTGGDEESATRQKFRKKLREGELDERDIEVEVSAPQAHMEIFAPPGMEELTQQIQGMFQNLGGARKKLRKMKASRGETVGPDVSRQGVQRDLLPLVEGTTVSTKYGMVKTDHILFIASGAFHLSKPSDLIPELQGRFPIRVELSSLSVEDFERILTATDACLTRQYQALLATEEVEVTFLPDGIRRLAEIAWSVNEKTENIGARRLHTVMEKLLEEISFEAGKRGRESVRIDAVFVDAKLKELAQSEDLARFVL